MARSEGSCKCDPNVQRSRETWPLGICDPVEFAQGKPSTPQSSIDDGKDVPLMGTGSKFRNDAPVLAVHPLTGNQMGSHPVTFGNGGCGIVTRGFDR